MKIYDLVETMNRQHKTIFDMPLRVTFYARVSTKRDEQLNSRENQIQTFTDLIKGNPNWNLINGYVDTVRGETAVNRDNFLRMIDDAKNGMFDLIVCKEISRFSRDILDSISYTRELLRNDVGVYFSSDGLCTIDRDSELRLGIMSSIAQQEVARLSERVKFGHRKAIENGVVMGNSRIYGYDKKEKKLVINPEEAVMVKFIFEQFATGQYSLRQMETLLWEQGYRSRADGKIMHNSIKSIIQNPKYKGYYCGGKVKITDYRTKEQLFLPENEWVMYKDETGETVPQIVDEELWSRANDVLNQKIKQFQRNTHGQHNTSPLSGMIVCADCGVPYYHNSYGHATGKITYHWTCKNKKNNSKSCKSFAIKECEFMHIMSECFKSLNSSIDSYVDEFAELLTSSSEDGAVKKKLSALDNEYQKLALKKSKLLDLYSDEIITKSEFRTRNDEISSRQEEILAEKAEVEESESEFRKSVSGLRNIKKRLKEVVTTESESQDLSDEMINNLCLNLVENISIKPQKPDVMDIAVKLKTGRNCSCAAKKGIIPTGNIIKKMIESYEQSAK